LLETTISKINLALLLRNTLKSGKQELTTQISVKHRLCSGKTNSIEVIQVQGMERITFRQLSNQGRGMGVFLTRVEEIAGKTAISSICRSILIPPSIIISLNRQKTRNS